MNKTLLCAAAGALALAPLAAQAQTTPRVDVPAGDLAAALDAYARQSGTQLVYRADQLKGVRTRGSHGAATSRRRSWNRRTSTVASIEGKRPR